MSQERLFLQRIQSHPGERERRLAYADWLEERDDPRGSLIRLEEKMRLLPAYTDLYWRLKPQRNELRAQCGAAWLAQMRYGAVYEPMFQKVPRGRKARWRLLREFIERWKGIPMADVGAQVPAIRAAERKLRARLSPSIAEWIAFCEELLAKSVYDHVIRDCYQIERLPELGAVSLMIAGESDFHWAVKEDDLEDDDPAVEWFGLDEHDRFKHYERIAPHVTEFVFKYLNLYLEMCGPGRGFRSHGPAPAPLFDELAVAFPIQSRFDDMRLFETTNMLVTVSRSHGGEHLTVHTRTRMSVGDLPTCLREYARAARWI